MAYWWICFCAFARPNWRLGYPNRKCEAPFQPGLHAGLQAAHAGRTLEARMTDFELEIHAAIDAILLYDFEITVVLQ
jgi:hypothetical protein